MSSGVAGLKVARVSTVAFFVETQLKQQIKDMMCAGMSVTVIASDKKLADPIVGARYESIKIARNINFYDDLRAIFKLSIFFWNKHFDIVHSTTPKAGLVTAIAGWIARVPIRIHTFTGQVWVEKTGLIGFFAQCADRIVGRLSTVCYADSHAQVQFLLENKIIPHHKIKCLGYGSLSGVDLKRFNPALYTDKERFTLFNELDVPVCNKILIFIGRCTRDKGVKELLEAFDRLVSENCNVNLLIAGPVEDDVLNAIGELKEGTKANLRIIGHTANPEKYLAISDLLVLPSYREGFGTVVIEAAAMGVPAIGTQIYGLKDAIVDNETGCLVPVKNVEKLHQALVQLLFDDEQRHEMSVAASIRVKNCFSSEYLSGLLISEYAKLAKHCVKTR